MRVKFIVNVKLDELEGVVNNHLAGLCRLGYQVQSVDLKISEYNKKPVFTAVICEECLTDKKKREELENVPGYLR